MTTHDLQSKLRDILNDVTDWLKFAEAKHAALITFNLALISICFNIIFDIELNILKVLLYIIILFSAFSLSISLVSFLPQINNVDFIKSKTDKYIQSSNDDNNLCFYKVISRFDKYSYVEKLYKKCTISTDSTVNHHEFVFDLSEQVVQISKLCCCKYYLFTLSLKILIFPFILFFAFIIIA